MADDKKIIFSMVGLSKNFGPQKRVLNNIYLSFFYGAKIGISTKAKWYGRPATASAIWSKTRS